MVTAQGLTALVQENYSFYTVQYNLLLSVTAPLRHSSNVLRYCLIASYGTHAPATKARNKSRTYCTSVHKRSSREEKSYVNHLLMTVEKRKNEDNLARIFLV